MPELQWVEKHRPRSLTELVGSSAMLKKVMNYLTIFKEFQPFAQKLNRYQNTAKEDLTPQFIRECEQIIADHPRFAPMVKGTRALLLVGGSGVGKTTIAYASANDAKLDVVELNASDVRTKDALDKALRSTVQTTSLLNFTGQKKNGRLILIDEVDGGSERGGLKVLHDFVQITAFPIIMTANENEKKIDVLRDVTDILQVPPPDDIYIAKYLERVAQLEHITADDGIFLTIAHQSNGDFRAALNDLQLISRGKDHLTTKDLDMDTHRDIIYSHDECIRRMFGSSTLTEALDYLDQIDAQYPQKFRDISAQIQTMIDPEAFPQAVQLILYADRTLDFILREQNYALLPYFFKALAGLSVYARDTLPNTIARPVWTGRSTNNPVLLKFQSSFHLPMQKIATDVVPILRLIFAQNPALKQQWFTMWKMTEKEWNQI